VNIEADFATSVHFVSLAIQLRELHLDWSGWVSGGNLKLEVELVSDKVVQVPTLALPSISLLEV
jgi:hypothetical protein